MSTEATTKKSLLDKIMDGFGKAANKLPSPLMLFIIFFVVTALFSLLFSDTLLGVTAINPSTGATVAVNNLFSKAGVVWFLTRMITNFTGYAPLGLVLVMNFGIGLCEEVGLVKTVLKKFMGGMPPMLLTIAISWVGCMGNLASDAASVIIPPMAGMLFLGAGKNPIVGFMCGRAAGGMGFHSQMLIAGTDALHQGITNSAIPIASNNPDLLVAVTCNFYFMFASCIINTIGCALVTETVVSKTFGEYKGSAKLEDEPITALQNKALGKTGLAVLVYLAVIGAGLVSGFLLTDDRKFNDSPFLNGIIPLLFVFFLVAGLVYGFSSGFMTNEKDITKVLAKKTGSFNSYIVQVFAIAQFTALFTWSNIGTIMSIAGADLLVATGFTGLPLVLSYMVVTAVVGLLVSSNSAQYSIMAPIFVPMLMLLGYHPAFTQVIQRAGRSWLGLISPNSVYVFMILAMINETYDPDFTLGDILSQGSIPYTFAAIFIWFGQVIVWYLLKLPLGPGAPVMIGDMPLMI